MVAALTRAVRFNPDLEKAHGMLAELFQNWFNELTRRRSDEPDHFIDLVLRHRDGQFRVLKSRGRRAIRTRRGHCRSFSEQEQARCSSSRDWNRKSSGCRG